MKTYPVFFSIAGVQFALGLPNLYFLITQPNAFSAAALLFCWLMSGIYLTLAVIEYLDERIR
jgi:hypothetical protein